MDMYQQDRSTRQIGISTQYYFILLLRCQLPEQLFPKWRFPRNGTNDF
jgi:hypothetical protein